MPNNMIRHKRGFIPVSGGTLKAKRSEVVGSLRVINKAIVTSGTEQGSPNGTPGPTYAGGGPSSGGDFNAGGFVVFEP